MIANIQGIMDLIWLFAAHLAVNFAQPGKARAPSTLAFSQDSGLGPTVVIETADRPVAVALSKLDNGVLRLAPTVVPTPMIATAMAATSTPYSMAVEPESLVMK